MKKFILLASIALAAVVYQPAKAQVSLNINIGAQPYYVPTYYSHHAYYVPAERVYPYRTVVVHRPVYAPTRVYRTSYARPVYRNYYVKSYSHQGKGHFKSRGHGKHGRH